MDFKQNLKYFNGKNYLAIVGAALILVGIIVGIAYYLMFGIGLAVIGIAIIAFGSGAILKDEEYDEQIKNKVRDMTQQFIQDNDFDVDNKLHKILKPETYGGYDWKGDEKRLSRKGRQDGKYRSSIYYIASIIYLNDRLCIFERRFSFIDDYDDKKTSYYNYTDIDKAEKESEILELNLVTGKTVNIERWFLNLYVGGKRVLSLPIENGADTDKTVEDINDVVKKAKTPKDQ